MTTQIVASLRIPGLHHWPNAPASHRYLAAEHRHLFHIRAWCPVSHLDRDVEFIALGEAIAAWLRVQYGDPMQLYTASCEMLARRLIDQFSLSACEVLEDGENGALLQRDA